MCSQSEEPTSTRRKAQLTFAGRGLLKSGETLQEDQIKAARGLVAEKKCMTKQLERKLKSCRNIYKVFKMTILCSKKFMKRNVLQEALKHQKVI